MKIMPRSSKNAENINRLHAVAIQMAVDSRNPLRPALSAARNAGQLLSEEKKLVHRRMGRGA